MTGQPLRRISRSDLDKLMTLLEINHVRLSECALTAGTQLEIARSEHPTIHYGFAGSGVILVQGVAPIELRAHTLVIVPGMQVYDDRHARSMRQPPEGVFVLVLGIWAVIAYRRLRN